MNMAFLSSFRIGQQTVYPAELRERLHGFALLENVGDGALKNLLAEANWFGLPGGMLLKRDGENNQALFLVVTGSLGVFVDDEKGKRRLVAHVPAGETVGEMSLISGEPHSAQLVALRDTELLRISPEGFDNLIARHPLIMRNLMRVMIRRLQETTKNQPAGVRAGRHGFARRGARRGLGRAIGGMVQPFRGEPRHRLLSR
jgi:NTE family protein